MPARLIGQKLTPGLGEEERSAAEVLLLRRREELDQRDDLQVQHWEALVKPGRRLKPGTSISFGGLVADVMDWGGVTSKGERLIRLRATGPQSVDDALQELGKLPLPPYIKSYQGDTSLYQTVYAQEQNSAAAPTAGLHFSDDLLKQASSAGIELARVCLEIGLDTFRKVEEEFIEDHHIHTEAFSLSDEAVQAIQRTKERGGRVVAVGTTVVRSLESAVDASAKLQAVNKTQTGLYITPGYEFKVVDALITNFHAPRTTLLMLVAAFMGYEAMMEAYKQAIGNRYRFLSFGDAMLIV